MGPAEKQQANTEARYEDVYREKNRFSFGKNWADFLSTAWTEERLKQAEKSLKDFLGGESALQGKTFADIGCGSGLFSLAAYRLGARVISVDVDDFSVDCARKLKNMHAPGDSKWEIKQGSALDREFMRSLGQFDIVYSWGVLHHTGHMWQALDNAILLLGKDSLFYLAIYNRGQSAWIGTSEFWLSVKKAYNRSGFLGKKFIFGLYFLYFLFDSLISLQNPLRRMKKFNRRGMNWYHNVIDWLGGLPYEFAAPWEVVNFYSPKKIYCERIENGYGLACVEYRLKKVG